MKAFGYSDITGIIFELLRRFRELIWIGIGLAALAVVGRPLSAPLEDSASYVVDSPSQPGETGGVVPDQPGEMRPVAAPLS